MKKILKKAMTVLCAMALVIGVVGGIREEAYATSKTYNGYVYVSAKMPSWTSGELTVSQGKNSVKTGWTNPGGTTQTVRILGQAKSGQTAKVSVSAKTSDGTFSTSFTVKAADLSKNKKFTVKFKTSGFGVFKKVTGIYV